MIIAPRPTVSVVQSATPSPSNYGQAVTFTVAVSSGLGVPAGTVTLVRGDVPVATGALTDGQASLSVTSLNAGSNPLSVQYSGWGGLLIPVHLAHRQPREHDDGADIVAESVEVGPGCDVYCDGHPVAPGAGAVTGSVEFLRDGAVIATVPLSSGRALWTINTLAVGKHTIQARYVLSANYAASTSAVLQQTVKGGGK